jgi:hypothetical protein
MTLSSSVNAYVNHFQKKIAFDVGGTLHEILPENSPDISALIPLPQSYGANCVAVRSEQEVIFLALQNPDWMLHNLCIQPESSVSDTCEFLDIRFKLLY